MDRSKSPSFDFLERMKGTMLSLSNSERRVARLCIQDPVAFANLAVSKIANGSHVSNPTVIRFCRKAGYSGLVDLKRTILQETSEGIPFLNREINVNLTTLNVAHKIVDNVLAAMLRFRSSVNADQIQSAVEQLYHTHKCNGKVLLMGVGASALIAHDAKEKLYRLGVNAHGFSEIHEQIVAATIANKSDTLIIFSNSGRTRDAINVCEVANKRELATIVVTQSGSPLYSLGKLVIASDSRESYEGFTPMLSRLQQLVVVDILISTFSMELNSSSVRQQLALCEEQLSLRRI